MENKKRLSRARKPEADVKRASGKTVKSPKVENKARLPNAQKKNFFNLLMNATYLLTGTASA